MTNLLTYFNFPILNTSTLILFLLLTGCGEKKEIKILVVAHGLDKTHSVHQSLEYMGQILEQKSKGKLGIRIYPNQQLGTERELLELLQIGSISIAKVSASVLENFVPKYKVLSLPYIFRDRDHMFRALDGPVGDELLRSSERFMLKGLGFYDSGSRSFYTKDKPIMSPSDLKGLKIRTQESPTAMAMINAMGGSATPISFGELYTALQAGVVDGAENNPPSYYLTRHYEVCKYYSINEHASIPDVILMGTRDWKSLNPTQQNWLVEAVVESELYQRKLWKESEKFALEQVKKAGVQVVYPDKSTFISQTASLLKEYQQDPELKNLMKSIKNIE